jgi:hypothetical protein
MWTTVLICGYATSGMFADHTGTNQILGSRVRNSTAHKCISRFFLLCCLILLEASLRADPPSKQSYQIYHKLMKQQNLRFSQRWKFKSRSSGLWRRVVLGYDTNVSEIYAASFFMVKWSGRNMFGVVPEHYVASQDTDQNDTEIPTRMTGRYCRTGFSKKHTLGLWDLFTVFLKHQPPKWNLIHVSDHGETHFADIRYSIRCRPAGGGVSCHTTAVRPALGLAQRHIKMTSGWIRLNTKQTTHPYRLPCTSVVVLHTQVKYSFYKLLLLNLNYTLQVHISVLLTAHNTLRHGGLLG